MSSTRPRTRLSIARHVTRISYVLLMLTLAINAWQQNLAPALFAIILVPLMLFIPGMLRDNPRTLIWICFVTLMYFLFAVDNLAGPTPNNLDILEMLLCVVLFCAAMLFSRWQQEFLKHHQQPD